jgi:hypothetical protein
VISNFVQTSIKFPKIATTWFSLIHKEFILKIPSLLFQFHYIRRLSRFMQFSFERFICRRMRAKRTVESMHQSKSLAKLSIVYLTALQRKGYWFIGDHVSVSLGCFHRDDCADDARLPHTYPHMDFLHNGLHGRVVYFIGFGRGRLFPILLMMVGSWIIGFIITHICVFTLRNLRYWFVIVVHCLLLVVVVGDVVDVFVDEIEVLS